MREMSFTKKWAKLSDGLEFTTFRVPRKDTDWREGENVRIVYHARCKDREVLGEAIIIGKEPKAVGAITNDEAVKDGFPSGKADMWRFMLKSHKGIEMSDAINKLTLWWTFRYEMRVK